MTGVYVYEFAIGMGPKIWGTKKGETDYSIRAIPIGGYCALAGEDVEDDDLQKIPEDRRLQAKTPFQRFLIMFFGAGNNFIYAILLLFFIALVFGGTTMNPTLTGVVRDGAAYNAGMDVGDTVVKLNGKKITNSDDLSLYLALSNPEKKNKLREMCENFAIITHDMETLQENYNIVCDSVYDRLSALVEDSDELTKEELEKGIAQVGRLNAIANATEVGIQSLSRQVKLCSKEIKQFLVDNYFALETKIIDDDMLYIETDLEKE